MNRIKKKNMILSSLNRNSSTDFLTHCCQMLLSLQTNYIFGIKRLIKVKNTLIFIYFLFFYWRINLFKHTPEMRKKNFISEEE